MDHEHLSDEELDDLPGRDRPDLPGWDEDDHGVHSSRSDQQHAEEDRRRKEAAETRNSAEQLVHSTEKLIADNPDKIPGDVKSEVETALRT